MVSDGKTIGRQLKLMFRRFDEARPTNKPTTNCVPRSACRARGEHLLTQYILLQAMEVWEEKQL